ncbi:MAG: DEAD/DEAH box helicase [Thermoproteus sp. AZ2]|uniref:DEAD/DEAH box helicase n=1 Tax=Thermoproteus sp. AZ2 TaxID=1609232 RepID=A0ACC6V0C0_9CREN|nr:MAG: ATP-dependent helicase [Thermoproteus sp. AZ2]
MALNLLHPRLKEAVEELGYVSLTPAQERAIPVILSGAHTLLIAPTGSGKTEAALFPVFSKILERGARECVEALYITPLRALNRDILRRISALAEMLGLRVAVRHSDVVQSARREIYRSPPHLLITTPESLQILLLNRSVRRALSCVKHVVVDEVHELVDSKRGVQLAVGLERLVELAGEFQRIGLSATVGNKELVAGFLAGSMRRIEIVDVSAEKRLEVDVTAPTPSEEDYAEAEKLDVTPETLARLRYIAEVIRGSKGGVLVFTNTRDGAEFLAAKLKALLGDVVEVHHSSLSRDHRIGVEERFKSGELKAVVATSSLELGIDIGHVGLVVQYGSPRQVVRLVQRVGRSGHRLDAVSRGLVVAQDLEDYLESEVIADRAARRELEPAIEYHEVALDVLVHQLVGMALEAKLDGKELSVEKAAEIIRRAHPYANATMDDIRLALEFAERHRLLSGLKPRRGSIKYYFENVSMIPDEKKYRAVDQTSGGVVGELDKEFVFTVEPGSKIILSGRVWLISKIEGDSVLLYPEQDITGALPGWIGEEIPVPREIAAEVCRRRAEALEAAMRGAYAGLADVEGLADAGVPGPEVVRVHGFGKYAVVHVCLGSKGNEALGMYLSHHLSSYLGPVGYRADPYRVLLIHRDPIPFKYIEDALAKDETYIQKTLSNAVKVSRMFKYRFMQVAQRVGLLSRDAEEVPAKLIEAYGDDLPGIEAMNEIFVEKLDVGALMDLVRGLREGRYRLEYKRLAAPTALDKPLLEEALKVDFTYKGLSMEAVKDLVRKRILNREVSLLCLNCGWTYRGRAALLPEELRCPKCGMGALAVVKGNLDRALEVWRKFKARRRLDKEESKLFDELRQSAAITLEHGKLGVLVQLAHGVGPKTAVKVLNKILSGGDIWSAIIDAERQYAATRAFWGD